MASQHTLADDIVYDLVSIQYHALKGAEVYDRFLEDVHAGVADFFRQCKKQDEERAQRAHEFLATFTRGGIG
jgi:hypothetical protein